jgi:pimeloyl-ACP methyl ester carboxylesterase
LRDNQQQSKLRQVPFQLPEPDRQGFVTGLSTVGFHRIAYSEWGPADSRRVVVCVHGLTRQGRDFDYLASSLAARDCRVICPDLVGRGRSDCLPNAFDYVFPQYCADMGTLLAASGATDVDWVGSSLGGLIGMILAGLPGSPIRRLVVNDIGPRVPLTAGLRVSSLLSSIPTTFPSMEVAEAHFRATFNTYGELDDAHWGHITRHSVAWDPAVSAYRMLYDPKITKAFQWLWYYSMGLQSYWRDIKCPVLVIRGEESDFLTCDIAEEMRRAKPDIVFHDVPGVGHMPMLMTPSQIEPVLTFLTRS